MFSSCWSESVSNARFRFAAVAVDLVGRFVGEASLSSSSLFDEIEMGDSGDAGTLKTGETVVVGVVDEEVAAETRVFFLLGGIA